MIVIVSRMTSVPGLMMRPRSLLGVMMKRWSVMVIPMARPRRRMRGLRMVFFGVIFFDFLLFV